MQNGERVKPFPLANKIAPFTDPAINNFKHPENGPNVVSNPIQNFDGPDADTGAPLFGTRFIPPDTNGAVGPNHFILTTNMGMRIYDKTGTPVGPQFRMSQLMSGLANAGDDDGDPVVVYDQLADRWILSQFNLQVTNSATHIHVAISETGDPTGAYFAYDFLLTANRPGDYPHMGVWADGYYVSTNDFSLPVFSNPFQGAGLYALERDKMLVGDPTALIIRFNTNNMHGGLLPSNLQGFTAPPVGTPNLFFEFDADEFGAATDLIRSFAFHADFDTPANSTVTQGPDIPVLAFDARSNRTQQPAPGENLDSLADRLMHPLNFRILPGGVQSYVLNWTVNVSGVNPTNATNYQAGVRWMELRRNAGTGAVTINQQATYAPGAGVPTGRDIWMAGIAQDGEGNIGLAASATAPGPTPAALNPTAIYTGRLAGDPVNTLPQGEVDAMAAVAKGLQIANSFNRWGDYSSLFIDPADDCTFWGAFEYVDTPNASFDWNTRVFSFKVNPTCVTAPRGTINGTITNCVNGQPITDAFISTPEGFARVSNASGQFSMIVAPGTYTVTVSGPSGSGFGTCTQTVTVAAGGTATVNCCLAPSAIIAAAGATIVAESCTPANGVLDPNETVTVSLCVQNTGGGNTTNLVGTLAASGGVTNPSGPQNYGVVIAGGPPVCRDFTFTVNGTCGGTVTATLQLQDGATNLGTVTYTFNLGILNVALTENFDGVTAPALPAGWVSAFTNGDGDCTVGGPLCTLGSDWTTVTSAPVDTAPNALFHNDPSCVTNDTLDTPNINITSTAAQVTFRNNFNTESTFDGGVLEVSSPNINGGAFTDITNAAVGGSFVAGGYNATISTQFLSPIAGRQAWSGNSGGFITTTANLGPNVAGQTIKLRFRFASDCSVAGTAWRIDTVRVTDGLECSEDCGGAACIITCPANITVSNDPNQCGAVVNYPAPTSSGTCGTITCSPPSGSFFPVGTTTVTCQAATGGGGGKFKVGGKGKALVPQGDGGCTTITHSSSQAITPLNSVSCNDGVGHTDNSYWRAFTLSSFGINGAFDVQSVDVAIEDATSGGGAASSAPSRISKRSKFRSSAPAGGGQPITVRIYTSSQTFPTGFPSSLTQIGTATVNVADQAGTILNVPITGTAAAGSELVVEVFTPDGTATGNLFFIGSNAAPETGPSYLSAADCGITTPTTTTAIGFPTMHIVLNVNGCEQQTGTGPTCSFTVTVNDTQPPTITCPANVTVVTPTVGDPCTVVNFTTTASDNCPGVVVVCNPPSGSCFPVGVTTVTCTATDASGNTATCSFTVSTFSGRLQDDTAGCNNVVLFNTLTGDYRWCCNGTIYTGRGKVTKLGNTFRIEHNPADRRVLINLSAGTSPPSGNASLQSPPGTVKCVIQDRDTRNDTCLCGAPLAN